MNRARFHIASFVALAIAQLGGSGCAAAPSADEPDEEEAVATSTQALSDYALGQPLPVVLDPDARPSSNCKAGSGDRYVCRNWFRGRKREGASAYPLFLNLDPTFEQRLEVTNTSSDSIVAFACQGGREGPVTALAPGATATIGARMQGVAERAARTPSRSRRPCGSLLSRTARPPCRSASSTG